MIAVITNLISVIPYVGKDLIEFIYGGFNIGGPTLSRFYSLHYLLPFIIAGISIVHLIAIHDSGGSNPLGISSKALINFHPYYTFKDILGFILLITGLLYIVSFIPNSLGHSDNYIPGNMLVTPDHIVPEWYLLPFYAILRAIPNKTLGVLAMIAAIAILFTLPHSNNYWINTSKFRPMYLLSIYILITVFILLLWIGQAVVEDPYILIGQILTGLYFFIFILLLPIISFIESFLWYISIKKSK